jgi:hypothetical protein
LIFAAICHEEAIEMGKFKTRIDGTPAQIGQKYMERDTAYPYGTRRHGSGTNLPAQSRSVDSMKSTIDYSAPPGEKVKTTYQGKEISPTEQKHLFGKGVPLTAEVQKPQPMSLPEHAFSIEQDELNKTYIDGHIDQTTYEKARTIQTNHWVVHHEVMTSENAIGEALITQGYDPGIIGAIGGAIGRVAAKGVSGAIEAAKAARASYTAERQRKPPRHYTEEIEDPKEEYTKRKRMLTRYEIR